MSIINKKPFIISVLETLTSEQAVALKTLINGGGDPVFRSLNPYSASLLTASDKGVKAVTLELPNAGAQSLYNGYLIYNNTYCVLVAYSGMINQQLTLIKVDMSKKPITYEIKPCEVSIAELRSELDDLAASEGLEVEAVLAEKGVPVAIKVDDITELTSAQLDALKNGDLVLKHLGNGDYATYVVSDCKKNGKIHLTYADNEKVENVVYTKVAQNWGYTSTTTQALNHANVLGYTTTAPTEDNTDGLKVVVLTSEPATKYAGYIYLITEE